MREHTESAMLDTYFHTETALGSKATLLLVVDHDDTEYAHGTLAKLWRRVFEFEKQFSRFLPNSELSQFNRTAGPRTSITPEFRDLLIAAKQISSTTEGLFNPFILPALQRAGYTKSMVKGYEHEPHDDYSNLQVATPDQLIIGDTWASIPYGSAIDMGGCGKGYLADKLSEMVKEDASIKGYWFSLGGDIVGGGYDASGNAWKVELQESDANEAEGEAYVQTSTKPFAVATSGTRIRGGKHKGKVWHHILDPRTSQPAETDIFMASVTGESAIHADVLASCAIILGSDDGPKFLKKQPEVKGYLLQCMNDAGHIRTLSYGKSIKIRDKSREPAYVQ